MYWCRSALRMTIGLMLGVAAGAATIPIDRYDVVQTPGSGFGCWFHNYTGTLTDTRRTVSGSVICSPDGGHIFNYSGGSGTLNDGLVDTTHLLLTRADDRGKDLKPEITVYLDRVATINQVKIRNGTSSFTSVASVTVEFNGSGVSFVNPSPEILGDFTLDLSSTALAGVATNKITLKKFSAAWAYGEIDQFGIGEIEVDGTDVVVGPTTKDQCKENGWKQYRGFKGPFKNQGDCIQFVITGK